MSTNHGVFSSTFGRTTSIATLSQKPAPAPAPTAIGGVVSGEPQSSGNQLRTPLLGMLPGIGPNVACAGRSAATVNPGRSTADAGPGANTRQATTALRVAMAP